MNMSVSRPQPTQVSALAAAETATQNVLLTKARTGDATAKDFENAGMGKVTNNVVNFINDKYGYKPISISIDSIKKDIKNFTEDKVIPETIAEDAAAAPYTAGISASDQARVQVEHIIPAPEDAYKVINKGTETDKKVVAKLLEQLNNTIKDKNTPVEDVAKFLEQLNNTIKDKNIPVKDVAKFLEQLNNTIKDKNIPVEDGAKFLEEIKTIIEKELSPKSELPVKGLLNKISIDESMN